MIIINGYKNIKIGILVIQDQYGKLNGPIQVLVIYWQHVHLTEQ